MAALKFPCEISAKYVIPAIRLMIARKLIDEYGLTQSEVARLLGVTQPSISHYLNSKRGIKMARTLSRSKEIRNYVDEYVKRTISTGSPPRDMSLCKICKKAIKRVMTERGRRIKRSRRTG